MKTKALIPLLLLLIEAAVSLSGQSSDVLDGYIREAFASSHVLKEKQLDLERSLVALEEAKRLYYPEVSFGGSYTLAQGGRTIAFPVGDLLNPVYSTLNALTQSNAFPQIDNVNEQLLPDNFYDVRLRARQPLINAEIRYARLIREAQTDLPQIEMQVYRRELVQDVRTAYYRFLQAGEAVRILERARALLQESRRVNESLVRNDKAIPSVLVRTDSEIAAVEAQLAEARTQERNAAAYFNHLLNRDLSTPVTVDSTVTLPLLPDQEAPLRREELDQLAKAREINQLLLRKEEAYHTPNVGLQLDLGSQGFDFKWGGYALLGLSVEIPLWSANRNKLRVQQAAITGQALQEQLQQVESQIQIQTQTTRNSLAAEQEIYRSYDTQVAGAQRFYNDTFRRYREGVANYIELLDARTQLTTVEIRRSIAYYNVLIRGAELERALGAYALPGKS